MSNSILPREDIPAQLWADGAIYMPDCLVSSYRTVLEEYSMIPVASSADDPGHIIGGPNKSETLEYFARRYGVSTCRIESLVIDPHGAFMSISKDIINIFAEGRIALLDIACGPGSVGASLLSTLYVLRKEHKLPKTPTSVQILGGDCSDCALDIYTKMMNGLAEQLKTVGIDLELQANKWNAEESYATSELFDILFDRNRNADEYVVFIANFSGAMSRHFDQYQGSFQHVFDRTHNKRCAIVWVEPGASGKAQGLFNKIPRIADKTPWARSRQIGPIEHEYRWMHPFQNRHLPCRVLLKAYERR